MLMSFISTLKDYVDHMNALETVLQHPLTLWVLIKSFFVFVYKSVSLAFVYFISFKWLTDFIELPAFFKQNYLGIIEGKSAFEGGLRMQLVKEFFPFGETSIRNSNPIFIGFLNSFFLALPLSVPHILSLRAFLINGVPAGVYSIAGTLFGQILFFGCVLFGAEFFLVPFFHLDGLVILGGIVLLINLVYKMIHLPDIRNLTFEHKRELNQFFKFNFVLAWIEQVGIFSYFGNLTLTPLNNLIQTNSSPSSFFIVTIFYLLSLTLGSLLWTGLFSFVLVKSYDFISNKWLYNIPFHQLKERMHYICLTLVTLFCFNTIPYYGWDYLIANPLGFIYQDQALKDIKPKIHYRAYQPSLKKTGAVPLPYEMVLSNLPFDEEIGRHDSETFDDHATYEQYSVDPERAWTNRMQLKRLDADAKSNASNVDQKSKTFKSSTQPVLVEIPIYDTPGLKQYENDMVQQKSKYAGEDGQIEKIVNDVFRTDIYVGYANNRSVPKVIDLDTSTSQTTFVHRLFRQKYLANPIYKAFTHLDMRAFLNGQIPSSNLTPYDEAELMRRRIVLENYVSSISTLRPHVDKSYAEKVYNQQFKGSLNVIRRYDSVRLNDYDVASLENNTITKKVLKFDQPKYNEFDDESKILLHEELPLQPEKKQKTGSSVKLTEQKNKISKRNKNNKKNKVSTSSSDGASTYRFYLHSNNTAPFYIGWDKELRKFLVKTPSVPSQIYAGDRGTMVDDKNNISSRFSFQSWTPLMETKSKQNQKRLTLPTSQLSKQQIKNLKQIFNIDSAAELDNLTGKQKLRRVLLRSLRNQELNDILKRSPNYDWYWKKNDLNVSFDFKGFLDLGDALPPKLDGITWPGVQNPFLRTVTKP